MTVTTSTEPLDLGLRGKDLFDHIRKTIDHSPELWDQGMWASRPDGSVDWIAEGCLPRTTQIDPPCGTAYCVAGWACVLSGESIGFRPGQYAAHYTADGEYIDVRAQDLLGLTQEQADGLFAATNDREDLDVMARRIWPEQA